PVARQDPRKRAARCIGERAGAERRRRQRRRTSTIVDAERVWVLTRIPPGRDWPDGSRPTSPIRSQHRVVTPFALRSISLPPIIARPAVRAGAERQGSADLRRLRRPSAMPVARGNSLADAVVRPRRVGVGAIAANRGAKMRLARDEHMVEALSAHAAEETLADGVGVRLDPIAEHYCAKCRRTFAAIWRSVILSTVSTPAMRPPRSLLLRRFVSSPFASPGPNIRM